MIAAHKLSAAIRSLRIRTVTAQWLCTLGLSAMLVMLPFAVRLNGRPHADWLQFLGRFHPLLVHLPIGMLVLLPCLELAGTTLAVEEERFLGGEGRAGAIAFGGHLNPLLTPG